MHYKDLTIRNFRGIKDLTLPKLGRVNLLAGKNNTGKSSVLEALQLHAQNGSHNAIHEILTFREEIAGHLAEATDTTDSESSFELSTLFRGFPTLADAFEPIHVSSTGKDNTMELTMDIAWASEEISLDGRTRLSDQTTDFPTDAEDVPVLRVATEDRENVQRLDRFPRYRRTRMLRPNEERLLCQKVNSGSGQGTNELGPLWDRIALTDRERDVIDALRIFDQNIKDFAMVGWGRPREATAMVRAANINHPVPLRSFGDGMNRLLGIMLALVNAGGGILLIDEFENGLHYSVQIDAWLTIFKLARDLDIQVFVTTHSLDTIFAFQKVASDTDEVGVLIRLNRRGDEVIPTAYSEEELAIAAEYAIEVR